MQRCPCGFLTDPDRQCVCPAGAIRRYKSRLSGPLLDRIDMYVEVAPVSFEKLSEQGGSDESKRILERVMGARAIQKRRFSNRPRIYCNAQMGTRDVRAFCRLDGPATRVMKNAVNHLGLSSRGFNRLLKVARTIADVAGEE